MRLLILFMLLFLFSPMMAQVPGANDSIPVSTIRIDSLVKDSVIRDSIGINAIPSIQPKGLVLDSLLKRNIFLRSSAPPVAQYQAERNVVPKDGVFYIMVFLVLSLGILRLVWTKYFDNMIRVFFNTSLRQGQLTDQLLQARLPSMFFNLFFVMVGGWYIYLLLNFLGKIRYDNYELLLLCMAALAVIYLAKFIVLKFTGWLTGYQQEAETYIFIVFLINKVIAICLLPVIVIMPFAKPGLVNAVVIISYIFVCLMFLLRFFRSYGMLQSKMRVSRFHFFLYIISVEIIPLLLIYKGAVAIMSKNL